MLLWSSTCIINIHWQCCNGSSWGRRKSYWGWWHLDEEAKVTPFSLGFFLLLLHTIAYYFKGAPISFPNLVRNWTATPKKEETPRCLQVWLWAISCLYATRAVQNACALAHPGERFPAQSKTRVKPVGNISKSIHTVQDIIPLPLAITLSVRWITEN